jgi:thioredoxin reductase/bacterioferritin-associated ferredoxin
VNHRVADPIRDPYGCTTDVAIVGAGPAGLAAAIAARRCGASVLVIDEYARAGGQYLRQPAGPTVPGAATGRGGTLAAQAAHAGVEFMQSATVWAGYPDGTLSVDVAGRGIEVRARRLVIAAGAHDRAMPFPGWTLPGVTTPGAAQAMLKAHAVLPGRRVVVAGSGPFLLVVAADLARAGAAVELVESAAPNRAAAAGLLGFPSRWPELTRLLAALAAHRVRIHLGRVVTEVSGPLTVAQVVTRRVGPLGDPVPGTERVHEADALAVAFGFRVQSELGRVLGCEARYDEARGGHVLLTDPTTGRTSLDWVYAAGEVTGLGGHARASAEGTIAGTCAARALGFDAPGALAQLADASRRRARAEAFAALVARTFEPPAGLAALPEPGTPVCRCEGVTRAEIDAAIDAGAHTVSAVKRWTRCGMGRCQGRICAWPVTRLIAHRLGRSTAGLDNLEPRLPIKPVGVSCLTGNRPAAALPPTPAPPRTPERAT